MIRQSHARKLCGRWHRSGINGPHLTMYYLKQKNKKSIKMNKQFWCLMICSVMIFSATFSQNGRWSVAKANEWYAKQGWLRGSNFQPSSAINQLEMFQAASFDTATINRELGWAAGLGFNVMRVYLHHLLWTADKEGFKKRLDKYLEISSRHGIKTL